MDKSEMDFLAARGIDLTERIIFFLLTHVAMQSPHSPAAHEARGLLAEIANEKYGSDENSEPAGNTNRMVDDLGYATKPSVVPVAGTLPPFDVQPGRTEADPTQTIPAPGTHTGTNAPDPLDVTHGGQ